MTDIKKAKTQHPSLPDIFEKNGEQFSADPKYNAEDNEQNIQDKISSESSEGSDSQDFD